MLKFKCFSFRYNKTVQFILVSVCETFLLLLLTLCYPNGNFFSMGNLGRFPQGKPAATELHYPTLINYKVHAGSFPTERQMDTHRHGVVYIKLVQSHLGLWKQKVAAGLPWESPEVTLSG